MIIARTARPLRVVAALVIAVTGGCTATPVGDRDRLRDTSAEWFGVMASLRSPTDIVFIDVVRDEWAGDASGVAHVITAAGDVRRYSISYDGDAAHLETMEFSTKNAAVFELANLVANELLSHDDLVADARIPGLSRSISRFVLLEGRGAAALPVWYDPTSSAVLRRLPAVRNAELAQQLASDEEGFPLRSAAEHVLSQPVSTLALQMDALCDMGLAVIILDAAADDKHWLWKSR